MKKGKWYKEINTNKNVYLRYFRTNKNGYHIFDKSNISDKKYIIGYRGIEMFLVEANHDEIKHLV